MKLLQAIKQLIIFFFILSLSSAALAKITPAIWKVEHQGTTSYLLGSIHVGDSDWYPFPYHIAQAFKASDKLVVELNTSQNLTNMTKQMMLPAGQTLQSVMSPSVYSQFESHIKSMGIPTVSVVHYKPWAAATVIAVLPYLKAGLEPQFGVDVQFLSRAKKRQMPIIELETAQFQIDLLSSLFSDEQMIVDLIKQPVNESYKLIGFWKTGDMDRLDQLMKTQMTLTQRQLMLTQRNKQWVKKLAPMFQSHQSHFVVVGAAHMVGSDGIPALLKDSGIKVDRIESL